LFKKRQQVDILTFEQDVLKFEKEGLESQLKEVHIMSYKH